MDKMAIDYVVPMVFHDDMVWRENFKRYGRVYDERDPIQSVRYRNWGTEQMLIQLVKKNMPWVRTIYIILAQESQKQSWMDEEGVRVVYHHEIIPQRFLPTFNSRGIEMFLKDIPDLSEHFLYGNDDMFPIKPLKVEDFFVDGKPCIHMKEKPFPNPANNFQSACREGLNFVAMEFGLFFRDSWLKNGHSIAPILKSTCEHLWKRGRKEIEASVTPFRMPFNFNQYIYSWWQYFSGNYVDKMLAVKYVNTKKTVEEVIDVLCDDNVKIACINDNECADDHKPYSDRVKTALCALLND